jgi:hypothetical protein
LDNNGAEDNEDIKLDDNDELDPAVDASNNTAITEVVQKVDYSDRVPLLMSDDVALGQFAIFKVSIQYCDLMIQLIHALPISALNAGKQNRQQPNH